MIDWLWLLPTALFAFWLGVATGKRFNAGVTTGVVGTILAFLFWG